MSITVKIDTKRLERALRIAPQYIKAELGDQFDRIGKSQMKAVMPQFKRSGWGDGQNMFAFGARRLWGTFKIVMKFGRGGVQDMGVRIFSNSKTAEDQEKGATYSGKEIAVPLYANSRNKAEMYSRGRYPRLLKKWKNPRKIKGLFVKTFKGERYLCERDGKSLIPRYVLKTRTTNKKRMRFYETWDKSMPKYLGYLNQGVSKALARL